MKAITGKHRAASKSNGTITRSLKAAAFTTHHTKAEFSVRTFCGSFGLTHDAFTRLTGFSPRAVAHWASGRSPSGSAHKRLTELTRLFDALSDMVDSKAIGKWLKEPNPAFDG